MIITFGTNTDPSDYEGARHKENVTVIVRRETAIPTQFNICDFQCPYVEPKFAETGGVINDIHKNDKTPLLFELSLITDTVVIKLLKCEGGEEVEKATLNNNALGVFFPASFFPDQLKTGFIANWNLILDAFGPGRYLFSATRSLINQPDTLKSWFYDLEVYSDLAADNTIKIESFKTGKIEGGVDYTGFIWEDEIRFRGTFGEPEFPSEKDHIQDQDRNDVQVRDAIRTIYKATTELVIFNAIVPFIKDKLLANDMFISSYQVQGFLPAYRRFNVVFEDITPEYFERNSNGAFEFTFIDKQHTPVKTN